MVGAWVGGAVRLDCAAVVGAPEVVLGRAVRWLRGMIPTKASRRLVLKPCVCMCQ